MRAYTHRFISFAVQCAVILLLALGLSFSAGRSLAQDTPTETPVPTDAVAVTPTDVPTELPTVVPTDVPTEQSTDISTQQVPVVPTDASTEQATAAPTDAPVTPLPATPDASKVFTENFQDGETSGWLLTAGWAIADDTGNAVLAASTSSEVATLTALTWPYYSLSFRVRGSIQLNMSSGGSNFQVNVATDGAASLFKDGTLLAQSAGAPATDATVDPNLNWHTVNLLAPGNLLAVKIDNYTPVSISDPTLVGMGPLMFSTTPDNNSPVAFDDVSIEKLDAPPPTPAVVPTNSGVVPIPTAMNVTAEPTTEVTVESTVEVTQEATVEATVEATAEATLEATAEATVEPLGLNTAARTKLPQALVEILDRYASGDVAGAQAAAADYFITTDQHERINVIIWAISEDSAKSLASAITDAGDSLTEIFSIRVKANVNIETLIKLANNDAVGKIEVPPKATSTSNMEASAPAGQGTGTEITEGVDTTGASAWHNAATPVKGANVKIGVIDTGFGTAAIAMNGEYACLFQSTLRQGSFVTGDTSHGLAVVQILCDMAPAAKVYMYKATNATTLKSAIDLARTDGNKVILITMDLGASQTPGDGTKGGGLYGLSTDEDVYDAIHTARNAGISVIASAGNNSGRYVTLNYTSTSTTVPMTVYGGDTIHTSWNDWSGTSQNVTMTVTGTGSSYNNPTFNVGGARSGPPRAFATVPAGTCQTGCNVNLNISGSTGGIVLQIQVAGQGTIDAANVSPNIVVSTAGNIARPADSQDVIAVGAVCNTAYILQPSFSGSPGTIGLVRDSNSSVGPVFGSGGALSSIVGPTYTRDQVKPDLMTLPSSVSIAGSRTDSQFCNQVDGDGNPVGFSGTSSSAAHLAGMVALLVSNTSNASMSAFTGATGAAVDAIQNYLQTHTIDNTSVAANAVGYDMSYGAGTTVLGSPSYQLNLVSNPTLVPDQLPAACSSGALYVGLANPGAAIQDGSITNPYISIAEAMKNASASQCVVMMPGEYVAPIAAVSGTHTPAVLSYESATTFAAPAATNLWSVIAPPISIFSNGLTVDGFVIQDAKKLGLYYPIASGVAPFVISGASGAVIQNSSFSNFIVNASDKSGQVTGSTNVQLKNNSFTGFVVPFTTSGNNNEFTTSKSSTAVLSVVNSTGVVLTNNTFQGNSNTISSLTSNTWLSAIVGIKNSGVSIYDNRFESNTTGALIGIDSWPGSPGTGTRQSAEVRLFGNLFNANTMKGPLVHLFASQNLRFVNNTVVSNVMNGSTEYDGFFMYGLPDSTYTNMGNSAVEIHNNLFYNNGAVGRGLLQTVTSANENVGCGSITVPLGGVPVSNNWFSPLINGSVGACTDADPTDSAGLIQKSLNEPITAANFFGTTADPVNPFRLRPNTNSGLVGGINYGNNAALTAIFGSDLSAVKDLIGAPRVVLSGTANVTYQNADVDVGAYELSTAAPLSATNGTTSISEDPVNPVVFNLGATGGYTQTFAITSAPANYDTNPGNACLGQPLVFTPPNSVMYCPPPNFHTFYGAGNSNVPVTIGFSVVDNVFDPGNVKTGTFSITINDVNDDTPAAFDFNAIADYNTPITYQLTPSYSVGNFNLPGINGKDFPFTYTYLAQDNSLAGQNNNLFASGGQTTVQVLTAALVQAASNGGLFTVNAVPGQTGAYKFTYQITDVDGQQTAIKSATLVVLPRLAQEGTYDDASFYAVYNGTNWTPSYNATAYNTTLHSNSKSGIGESLEFPFNGALAKINLRSSTDPLASLKLEFKLNLQSGNNTYVDYVTAHNTTGLTCVSSLNGQQPDGSSTFSNYISPTVTAYTVTCNGLPVGQAHEIRVTNNSQNGAQFTVDSLEVASGYLKIGSYEETNPNITYTGTWLNYVGAGPKGGSMKYNNTAGSTISFKVVGSAAKVIIYRTQATGYGPATVQANGDAAVNMPASTTLTWAAPFVLSLTPGAVDRTITITNTSAQYVGFDGVDVVPQPQAFGIGSYEETNANVTYTGTWLDYIGAGPKGGSMKYGNTSGSTISFKVVGSAAKVIIYRTQATGYGPATVQANGDAAVNMPASTTLTWAAPFALNLTPGAVDRTITITNASTQYVGFEGFDVVGQPQTLGIGSYEETNANVTYTGTWLDFVAAGPKGGSMKYNNTSGSTVSFKVVGSAAKVVIYRTQANGYGPVTVQANGDAAVNMPTSTTLTWAAPFVLNLTPGAADRIITITNTSAQYVGFEGFDVLGQPQTLGIGSYEETNPNLTYTGTWLDFVAAGPKGGSMKYNNTSGSTVSFKVVGSAAKVIIYRTQATGYGPVTVQANGDAAVNMPTSTTLTWSAPFVLDLTPGAVDRTITITNTSAQYVGFEGFDVLGQPQTLGIGSYEETNPNLTYTGAWLDFVAAGPKGGSMKYNNTSGATVTFKVVGAAAKVVIYRTQATGYGPATVQANGDAAVNMPASTTLTWSAPFVLDLTPGAVDRTITITNTSAQYVGFEGFDVLGQPQTLGIGSYEETNPNLTYTGAWLDFVAAGPKGGSMKYNNTSGATVSFKVVGAAAKVVIYRTQATGYGPATVQANGDAAVNMPASTTLTWSAPFVLDLTPGAVDRTITITNTSAQYVGFEGFDVLGQPQTLGIGSYEETNPNLTYTGAWLDFVAAGPKGGSMKYNNTSGATVSFKVVGAAAKVVIYRTQATGYGPATVQANGDAAVNMPASTTLTWSAPFVLNLTPGAVDRTITITNASTQYVGFEGFDVVGPPVPFTSGYYEETDGNLTYTGTWSTYAGAGPSGGSAKYSFDPAATISFSFTGDALAVYRTLAPGAGSFSISIDGSPVTIPNASTTVVWQDAVIRSGLTNSTHTVVISKTSPISDFIYFDAIRVIDKSLPLAVGFYQDTYPAITYTGTWIPDVANGPSAGQATYTTAADATASFTFTGTGFTVFTFNPTNGADMQICYDTVPASTNVCSVLHTAVASAQSAATYGLKNGTYQVTVKHNGPSGSPLYLDSIAVLGTPSTTLAAGTYENTNAGIVYAPNAYWTTVSSPSYSGGSIQVSGQQGATAQFKFTGTSLTFYQTTSPTSSSNAAICVVVANAPNQCVTFSQNNTITTFSSPIAFYGFSSGTNEVVIENRSAGKQLNIDKITVN